MAGNINVFYQGEIGVPLNQEAVLGKNNKSSHKINGKTVKVIDEKITWKGQAKKIFAPVIKLFGGDYKLTAKDVLWQKNETIGGKKEIIYFITESGKKDGLSSLFLDFVHCQRADP